MVSKFTSKMSTKICLEGRIALISFILPIILIHLFTLFMYNNTRYLFIISGSACSTCHLTIQSLLKRQPQSDYHYKISLIALLLGELFCVGSMFLYFGPTFIKPMGAYINLLTFFHFSEFFLTAIINAEALNLDSYLLQNGNPYYIALMVSWAEYFIEVYYFKEYKCLSYLSMFGILLSIIGELFRKCAMLTAGGNFNHIIQSSKNPDHKLITHGIYSWFRHPAYVGWFYWAIGTQLTLLNPICFLSYTIVSWRFFDQRIRSEEITLLNFFGREYMDYQKRVGTGIFGIKGYSIEIHNKKTQ